MRRMIGETLERSILLQTGAAAVTRKKVGEVVKCPIELGRIERAEGRAIVREVLRRARERSAGARSLVDVSMQRDPHGPGVPTREVYDDFVLRVGQLEHRVCLLEGRPTASSFGGRSDLLCPASDQQCGPGASAPVGRAGNSVGPADG